MELRNFERKEMEKYNSMIKKTVLYEAESRRLNKQTGLNKKAIVNMEKKQLIWYSLFQRMVNERLLKRNMQ